MTASGWGRSCPPIELNVDFAPSLFGHMTDGASSMTFTLLRVVLAATPAYFLYRTARVRLMPKFV
jgi:hypothetical protein